MIPRDEALLLLRDACPSFAAHDVPRFADDVRGFGDMAEMSALARHLVDRAEHGEADDLPAVFEVVDRLIADGEPETVAFVRTHLIEDIQNITSHRDVAVAPGAFREVLGPDAQEIWDELDEAWTAAAAHAVADGQPRLTMADYFALGPGARREAQSMTREMDDGMLAGPADVLRFEATRHDEQLELRHTRLRIVPAVLVVTAIVIVLVGAFVGR